LINVWLRNIASAYLLKRLVMTPIDIINKNLKFQSIFKNFNPINFIYNLVGPISKNTKIALSQIESNVYLKNQLLKDSDWSSMAHGIELRTPLVDYTLLKEIQPYFLQLNKFPKKSLLSNAPLKPLTSKIYNKKKTGFGIPVKIWLKDEFNATTLNYSDLILQKYNQSIAKYLNK
jgi:asparagine synthase (glutamine-hydrolysing)